MQRMVLLESGKKSSGLPFVLNLILGLGIGSYVQGDTKGGTTALSGSSPPSLSFLPEQVRPV